ncbi:hypothetical protein SAMN04488109_6857 [Chryseolinea serpens]|uniref:Alkylhydroperoxidase family enzyme, contains CxxC motif n=1 Tax=Chryseolinea serpens TaxID=947013 RepID=A0A1M5XTG1_9BACT|nr:hypothetical protein [Chryseolinea serpens]SHI03090.1 hypothetical protein SAMN04488109_6857 [Chryseolinea serpens]
MPRILPLEIEKTPTEIKISYSQHKLLFNGRITNMKSTLGHSLTAFKAYMEWYPLFEEVKKILGQRLSPLFAWSISEASDCPLCSTYFRKIIIESGEDPENLVLSETDQAIVSFGAAIGRNKGSVPDETFDAVAQRFTPAQLVVLTAFAGIMIATNIFNNVLQTEIDEYLIPFARVGEVVEKSGALQSNLFKNV